MDKQMLSRKFQYVSREEVEKIKKITCHHHLHDSVFQTTARLLNEKREKEKLRGRESTVGGPLVHVISVEFIPHFHLVEPVTIRISYEFCASGKRFVHDLYNGDVLVLGPNVSLALSNVDSPSWPLSCMPLHSTRICCSVGVGTRDLAGGYICCTDDAVEFEQVRLERIRTELGVIALRYISMPFAIYGHVEINFFHKDSCASIDVKGKVVARYGNTYGGYDLEECTLFENNYNEFQRVRKHLSLSRCWVGVPVYSSLILDLDLLEFGSERKILKEIVEFRVENKCVSCDEFIVDDILINVGVRWVSPRPQGRPSEEEDESCDEETSSDDEQMNMAACGSEPSTNPRSSWQLRAHRNKLYSSTAVQIYSIFIGRENLKSLEVFGCVQVSSDECTFYGFNREANDAFGLSEGSKTIPVLNGSIVYDDCEPLEMKINLMDVESRLRIRGYVHWDTRSLEFDTDYLNKQLCSVVFGEDGFAAIHYSIFPEAVQANIGFLFTSKNGKVSPKVYGSIVAQYGNFDYTSRYAKDYYRVILFQRNEEDPGQTISLSSSIVVVPLKSSLIIDVNMWNGDDQKVLLQSTVEARIGTNNMSMENNDYSLHIYLKWVEVDE